MSSECIQRELKMGYNKPLKKINLFSDFESSVLLIFSHLRSLQSSLCFQRNDHSSLNLWNTIQNFQSKPANQFLGALTYTMFSALRWVWISSSVMLFTVRNMRVFLENILERQRSKLRQFSSKRELRASSKRSDSWRASRRSFHLIGDQSSVAMDRRFGTWAKRLPTIPGFSGQLLTSEFISRP